MSEATVKVVVQQESRGTALKDAAHEAEELRKKEEQLKGGGVAPAGKTPAGTPAPTPAPPPGAPAPNPGAPKPAGAHGSTEWHQEQEILEARARGEHKQAEHLEKERNIRRETLRYQRDYGVGEEKATMMAKQRVEAEARIAHQQHSGGMTRMMGDTMDKVTGSSGWVQNFAMLKHFGPIGAALLAVQAVADVGQMFVQQWIDKKDFTAREEGRGVYESNRRGRISGYTGARGQNESAADAERMLQKVEEERDKVGTFRDQGMQDVGRRAWNFFAEPLGGPHSETGGEKGERENKASLEQDEIERERKEHIAAEKFKTGPGGLHLDAQARRLRGDGAGALQLEREALYQETYEKFRKMHASEEDAGRGATQAVEEKRREDAQGVASHMVNARSGAGDIQQAAAIAAGFIRNYSADVKDLHQTVREQGQEAARPPHNW